jgi:phospholipase/carboxylesterase
MGNTEILDYNIKNSANGLQGSTPIFLIHGYGADKNDLFSFADYLPESLTVIALQAPLELPFGGRAWYSLEMQDSGLVSDIEGAKIAMEKIDHCIDYCIENYQLNGDKKFVLGFSQGAILSTALAVNKPEKYKYFLPLSGYALNDIYSVQGKDYSHLDFYAAHGTMDGVIPIEKGRSIQKTLQDLNIKHVYREFEAAHSIAAKEFEEFVTWITERL